MPINYQQQISPQGTPNRKGLEIYKTDSIYSGEHLNWGNALALGTGLNVVIDAIVSGDSTDPIYTALASRPTTNYTTGHWNRFHTETGTKNYVVAAPTSGSGYFTFNAASSGAKLSYAGIYQQLSTTVGTEYEIQVTNTTGTDTATLYVNTYFQRYNISQNEVGYKINTTANKTYPVTFEQDCILTSTFTAKTPNDFIMIYLTTTAASASINITNISIKEKTDILVPIYSEDRRGNAEKVLRREYKEKTFNT
tara:strand:+ start:8540 stop:9295 length:756 start_codon:yes stop_codon:yes gene_type:complete